MGQHRFQQSDLRTSPRAHASQGGASPGNRRDTSRRSAATATHPTDAAQPARPPPAGREPRLGRGAAQGGAGLKIATPRQQPRHAYNNRAAAAQRQGTSPFHPPDSQFNSALLQVVPLVNAQYVMKPVVVVSTPSASTALSPRPS